MVVVLENQFFDICIRKYWEDKHQSSRFKIILILIRVLFKNMYRYMYVHMDDIYVTRMRTSEGITSEFLIIISSHQGLAPSLYLFAGYE